MLKLLKLKIEIISKQWIDIRIDDGKLLRKYVNHLHARWNKKNILGGLGVY